MKTKTIKKNQDIFYYTRNDNRIEFLCERCEQNKKSKITIKWASDDKTKTICNGCYGYLLSV